MSDWREQAACRGKAADIFYSERGESNARAKRICARCPVVEHCLSDALAEPERYGTWGGLSERQRRFIRNPQSRERRKEQERAAKVQFRARESA